MNSIQRLGATAFAVLLCLAASSAKGDPVHVLANDHVTELSKTLDDPNDLWIASEELEAAIGFVLKPEGACLDEICIPIQQDEDSELFVSRDGTGWVNATALAGKLNQPVVTDREANVWSFGTIPATRGSGVESAIAPDFEMLDRDGNVIRLSDYRGKKVVIVTWASW